jgi:excisionase family DNA binding protein
MDHPRDAEDFTRRADDVLARLAETNRRLDAIEAARSPFAGKALLSVDEAMLISNLARRTIVKAITAGHLVSGVVGRARRITPEALDNYLHGRRPDPNTAPKFKVREHGV